MHDKQGREVLRARKIESTFEISALQRGVFEKRDATMEGVEITLYRDRTGKLSLVDALKKSPPSVQPALGVPPPKEPKKDPWLMDIAPIEVKDATLTLGFTKKPVVFHVDRAKISVKRKPRTQARSSTSKKHKGT